MKTIDPDIMIQDPEIAALYPLAPRFDEGEIFLGPSYSKAVNKQLHIYDLLVATYGQGITMLLEEYTSALYGEMECEAQHFFQEGYRAAKKALG